MGFYLLDNAQPVTQQWGYPRRGASLSGTCIIHTAECAIDLDGADSSAENCANFIRTRGDYGSYHTLVDSDSIIEMVPYEYEAWQDSETNPWAVGLSAAVQADNWHTIPVDRRDRIYRNLATAAADFVTYMATKGITVPLRRLTGQEARNRVPGFCAHGDSGVDRHDPGAQFDWALFFNYTRQALGSAALAPQSSTTTKELFTMGQYEDLLAEVKEAKDAAISARKGVWYGGESQGKTFKYGILPIVAESQRRDAVNAAQIKSLISALAAVAKGEPFDEAKLLAGVQSAAEAGVKAGIADGTVDVNVTVAGGQ